MEVLKQLLGRIHPLIVHLPIGFMILGILLQWVDRHQKRDSGTVPLIFLWSGIVAVVACITGYLQYRGEGYAFQTVKWHLWLGISTALFAFVVYLRLKSPPGFRQLKKIRTGAFLLALFLLILLTGHQGSGITHGKDYLTEPLPDGVKKALGLRVYELKEIRLDEATWEEGEFYGSVLATILNNRCVSCHNPEKSKGGLHLDTREGILAGGENGEVITTGNPEESPMYARLVLSKSDEDHMPPKEKAQPAREEIALIKAWIAHGNPFDKTIGELGLDKSFFEPFFPKKPGETYPDVPVEAASTDSIESIQALGIHIQRISDSTNYLRVSCLNDPLFGDLDFNRLRGVGRQIAILDLGGTRITDGIMGKLASLPHLTTLKLDHTGITGKGLIELKSLPHLRVLNLTGTSFEKPYLKDLIHFKRLQAVYLSGTGLSESDLPLPLRDSLRYLEYGNYSLPALPSDSITY